MSFIIEIIRDLRCTIFHISSWSSTNKCVWYEELEPFIYSSSFERFHYSGIRSSTKHCDIWKKSDWFRIQALQEIPGCSPSWPRSRHGLRQWIERTLCLHLHPTCWLLVLLWRESVWSGRKPWRYVHSNLAEIRTYIVCISATQIIFKFRERFRSMITMLCTKSHFSRPSPKIQAMMSSKTMPLKLSSKI